jgi:hypothetical protein
MDFREPFSFITNNFQDSLLKMEHFLEAKSTITQKDIPFLDGLYLAGSNHLIEEVSNGIHYKEKFLNANPDYEIAHHNSIAKGLYAPHTYSKSDLPVILYYKLVPELDNKPVLTKEFKMKPGEFLIIPESSEYLCAVSYQDSRMDAKSELPEEFIWVQFLKDGYKVEKKFNFNKELADITPEKRIKKIGKCLRIKENFAEPNIEIQNKQFNVSSLHFQLFPFISEAEHQTFKYEMDKSNLWVRRTGDIYTQVAMDIIEWTKKTDCPSIIKEVLAKFRNQNLIANLSKLTGIKLENLLEISAYKLIKNEYVNNHSDGTFNNYLKVRVNWLIQNPSTRKEDMRFWNPFNKEEDVVIYQAIENSITIFKIGDETPHDIAPIPEITDKDRINIVLTYG